MPKNHPWFKFNAADYQDDTRLRRCSALARAVWVEMLCVMHRFSNPYGYMTTDDGPLDDVFIAQKAMLPLASVRKGIAELESRGVFSRTAEGIIFSRRMVRDEALRLNGQTWGKKGGNPSLTNKPTLNPSPLTPDLTGPHNAPSLSISNSSSGSSSEEYSKATNTRSSALPAIEPIRTSDPFPFAQFWLDYTNATGVLVNASDYQEAELEWRLLDFEQKLGTAKGIAQLPRDRPPDKHFMPANYLRRRIWERKPLLVAQPQRRGLKIAEIE